MPAPRKEHDMNVTLDKASDRTTALSLDTPLPGGCHTWGDLLADNDLMELWAFFGESRES